VMVVAELIQLLAKNRIMQTRNRQSESVPETRTRFFTWMRKNTTCTALRPITTK
jgi:hypothetical protein